MIFLRLFLIFSMRTLSVDQIYSPLILLSIRFADRSLRRSRASHAILPTFF